MFCRNCGKELTGTPEICTNCGAKPIVGTGFCPGCGDPTTPLIEVCTNCGARLAGAMKQKTWKPTAAGILCIIGGVICLLLCLFSALFALILMGDFPGAELSIDAPIVRFWIFGGIVIIIAIVGGICALRRRIWGLALAGSICALVGLVIPGILAIIFVVRGKREFERGARVAKELATDISPKSRRATTLLALFLGVFGAHRFYIGKTGTAIVMLLLSIAGLGIQGLGSAGWSPGFFGLIGYIYAFSIFAVVGIWAFVDFIFAVTGRMKDKEGSLIRKW
jgi:TM2 domain-containing membrane protein YozV